MRSVQQLSVMGLIIPIGGIMSICSKCQKTISEDEKQILNTRILCDDCYLDEVMPRMPKAHYDNEAEFMNRLKDSYSVRKQQYH